MNGWISKTDFLIEIAIVVVFQKVIKIVLTSVLQKLIIIWIEMIFKLEKIKF